MASLYFIHASMNAGKSSALLQAANNYKEQGMNTLLLKPAIDTRDSDTKIVSRIGISAESILIFADTNIEDIFAENDFKHIISCVFVDESQFLTKEQVHQLCTIVDKYDVPVMCYGLRTDFKGDLFEGSKYLLSLADNIQELKGMCYCGKKATMVARVDENGNPDMNGDQVKIGGNSVYKSMCRKHWREFTQML